MIGHNSQTQDVKNLRHKQVLQNQDMQNFSPRPQEVEKLQKIYFKAKQNGVGPVADFEDMIPSYANTNNTQANPDIFRINP